MFAAASQPKHNFFLLHSSANMSLHHALKVPLKTLVVQKEWLLAFWDLPSIIPSLINNVLERVPVIIRFFENEGQEPCDRSVCVRKCSLQLPNPSTAAHCWQQKSKAMAFTSHNTIISHLFICGLSFIYTKHIASFTTAFCRKTNVHLEKYVLSHSSQNLVNFYLPQFKTWL